MKIPTTRFSGYDELAAGSWKVLWRRPLLFFPIIYRMLGFLLIGLLLVLVAWLATDPSMLTTDVSTGSKALFLTVFVLSLLIFELHVQSLQVALFSTVAAGKDQTLSSAFRRASKLFRRVAGTILLFFLGAALLLGVGAGLLLMAAALVKSGAPAALLVVVIGLVALGSLLIALFLGAWLLFWMPLVAYTDRRPVSVLRTAWSLLFKDARHVWSTYLVRVAISLGIGILLGIVSTMIADADYQVPLWWSTINFILTGVLGAWMLLFTFKAFVARYKPKVA